MTWNCFGAYLSNTQLTSARNMRVLIVSVGGERIMQVADELDS